MANSNMIPFDEIEDNEDRSWSIRKSAIYLSQFLPQDDRLARCLLNLLPATTGWTCREIIASYVVHTDQNSLDDVLQEPALSEREEIACGCVSALSKRNAQRHLEHLVPLLLREPLNWGLQIFLLDAFMENGITATIPSYFFHGR